MDPLDLLDLLKSKPQHTKLIFKFQIIFCAFLFFKRSKISVKRYEKNKYYIRDFTEKKNGPFKKIIRGPNLLMMMNIKMGSFGVGKKSCFNSLKFTHVK